MCAKSYTHIALIRIILVGVLKHYKYGVFLRIVGCKGIFQCRVFSKMDFLKHF